MKVKVQAMHAAKNALWVKPIGWKPNNDLGSCEWDECWYWIGDLEFAGIALMCDSNQYAPHVTVEVNSEDLVVMFYESKDIIEPIEI